MKRVKLIVQEKFINKYVGKEFPLSLRDEDTILHAIDEVDGIIRKKVGKFPVDGFMSLLHMAYNPKEKRFYEDVAMHGSTPTRRYIPVRSDLEFILPDEASVLLILDPTCGYPEEVLKQEEFREAILKDQNLKYIKNNLTY